MTLGPPRIEQGETLIPLAVFRLMLGEQSRC